MAKAQKNSTEEAAITNTENAPPAPAYDGPPIETLMANVVSAENTLNDALKFHVGKKLMFKGLPHKVQKRGESYFLRCMVSQETLDSLKEAGLMR